jgi:hypothetical protein
MVSNLTQGSYGYIPSSPNTFDDIRDHENTFVQYIANPLEELGP